MRIRTSTTSKSRSNANYQQNQASGMKYEIANELGVNLGPDATARENGTVGGEMTKRLVSMAKSNLNSK